MAVAATVEEVTLAAGIWVAAIWVAAIWAVAIWAVAVTWVVAVIHIMVVLVDTDMVIQDSMDPITAVTISQV